jgi:hypothetical protein
MHFVEVTCLAGERKQKPWVVGGDEAVGPLVGGENLPAPSGTVSTKGRLKVSE